MYQVNVVLSYPNPDPSGKPIQKNFAFDIEKYNFYESIPRSVIDEESIKKGFDVSTLIEVAFDVRCVEKMKK